MRPHPQPVILLSAFSDLARKSALALRLPWAPPSRTRITVEAIESAIDALSNLGFPRDLLTAPAFRVRSRNMLGRLHETWGARLGLDPQSATIGTTRAENGSIETVESSSKRFLDPLAFDDATCMTTGATLSRPGLAPEKIHFALVSMYEGPIAPEIGANSTVFVVGHELGHVLCLQSGARNALADFAARHAIRLGLQDEHLRERALTMAEELYADAIGSMARPGDFLANCADIDALRCSKPAQEKPNPLHLDELPRRQSLFGRIASLRTAHELCGPDILSACFQAALGAVQSEQAPNAEPLLRELTDSLMRAAMERTSKPSARFARAPANPR